MADDKKIIFSMVGVSKSFQNNKILFLWSENRYHRFEWCR